jgi:hypothetical protein
VRIGKKCGEACAPHLRSPPPHTQIKQNLNFFESKEEYFEIFRNSFFSEGNLQKLINYSEDMS